MKSIIAITIACLAALGVAGCAVPPAQHADLDTKVANIAPNAWREQAPTENIDADVWWQQFGDPVMHDLVASTLRGNLDLQAAAERVRQAEALERQVDAARRPELDATAQAAYVRQNTPPPLGYVKEAGAGLALTWEPDVFGGQRLAVLAARARASGSRQALDALRLALAADTAAAYIDLRWQQNELQILSDQSKSRGRELALTEERLRYGLSTRLDVERARGQLEDIRAQIPRARARVAQQLHLLAVLAGRPPESVDALLDRPTPIPVPAQQLPRTLPSQALLRRPDVLEAYATIEQRAAEVGEAHAARYPHFQLSLTDGLLASSYLGLPTLTDNLFSAALNAASPIFDAGRIQAGIDANESRLRESELALHQTMLEALRQIEDARNDLVSDDAEAARLADALQASDHALQLSDRLYRGGAANFLDVLTAQQAYLVDAQSLNAVKRAHALAAVALYRALGGGWSMQAPDAVAGLPPQAPAVAAIVPDAHLRAASETRD
jgi:NodT family efflux transporter outer membrane factor (OMF) lipoprotein